MTAKDTDLERMRCGHTAVARALVCFEIATKVVLILSRVRGVRVPARLAAFLK